MIIAGYTDSWESSIDAVAQGKKVVVLLYDNKQPSVKLYNFSQDEAKEMKSIITALPKGRATVLIKQCHKKSGKMQTHS